MRDFARPQSPAFTLRKNNIGSPTVNERRLRFLLAARNLIFSSPRYPSGIAFESGAAARYDKTHTRSFRAAPPICGDTPLFFSSFFFFPLSSLLTLPNRNNHDAASVRERDLRENISDLFTRDGSVVKD